MAIEAIDAIEDIEDIGAIDCYRCYSGYGLLWMWAWWDGREQKVGFAEKKLRLWGLAWAAGWVDIEGRAQNIALLHLMRCLIAGYDLVGALRGGRKILRPYKWVE